MCVQSNSGLQCLYGVRLIVRLHPYQEPLHSKAGAATTMVDVFAIPAVVGPVAGVAYTLLMTLAVIPTVGGDGTLGVGGFRR